MKRNTPDQPAEILLWSLLLAASTLIYAWWPDLDLMVSRLAYDPARGFLASDIDVVRKIHLVVPVVGWMLFLWGASRALAWPGRPALRQRLAGGALAVGMVFGVAGMVNGLLKNHWGRARPAQVEAFGGTKQYSPPLQINRQCERNCSFVSGHASTGFALIFLGALQSRRQRRRWLLVGTAAGLSLGALRMAQGGHFLGDVIFSGLLLWGMSLALRALWVQLRRRRVAQRLALARS